MSTLNEKQRRFTKMVAELIQYAYANGYEMTFGDAYRDDRCAYGQPFSLHRKRLAIDLNLLKTEYGCKELLTTSKPENSGNHSADRGVVDSMTETIIR
jgi:hypothetical protein